jgi:AAA+ superfamily predicted ATPase
MHEVQSKSKDLGLEFGTGSGKFHISNIFAGGWKWIDTKVFGGWSKLVRELFCLANELSPSIVFIDEIDAVGTKR